MTVLHLISSAGYYGAENMLLTLVRALRVLGVQSVIGAFRNAQNPHLEVLEFAARENVPAEVISCNGRIDLKTVHSIRQCLDRHSARIVHSHGYKADLYGYFAIHGQKTPIAATCHNWTNDTRWVQWYGRCDRWILRRFPVVTAVSPSVATALRQAGVCSQNIRVIPNGIDVDPFAAPRPVVLPAIRRGVRVIGTAGRLVPQKGLLDLVAAAPAVLARFPETQFLIAGDGPQRQVLERAVQDAGMTHAFVFAGTRNDMPGVYSAMDIFVLPSVNEGMPMTVLEAMAAGLPIAASRVGAIPEVIRDGESGRLFSPGDRAGLTRSLLDLLENSTTRARMGAAGRTRVTEEYSSLAMARKYSGIYERLLGGNRAA